jgi:hypothetical protein
MRRTALGHGILITVVGGLLGIPIAAQDTGGGLECGSPYVVAKGDTLSTLARDVYGDPKLYNVLFEANRDVIGDDPGNVALGTSIMIPCLDENGQPMTAEAAADSKAAMVAAIASQGPLTAEELETLFGPVALFPDPLLTQVMMATTYPLDVMKADRFVKENKDLPDKERAAAAEAEFWDPSVRQLAAGFPDLITRMADHIDWTEQAGEAVVAQTEDVLTAIQSLRTKAQENGYLTENDAQTVQVVDENIYITPADPEVVYVPMYDTQVVYTTPLSSSSYNPYYYGYADDDWSDALAAGAIIFGSALILDEIFDDNDNWGDWWDDGGSIDWDTGDINIDRGDINIDRGDINVGDINVGDGNRPNIGDGDGLGGGDRPNLGDGNRPNIGDRGPRASTLPARIGGAEGDALAGNPDRTFAPDAASRDVARKKIETRKATMPSVADLPATRPSAKAPVRKPSAAPAKARPSAGTRPTTASRPTNVTRPTTTRRPSSSASYKPKSSSAFRQSGGSRASAGSSRGRSSSGGRGGGGRR